MCSYKCSVLSRAGHFESIGEAYTTILSGLALVAAYHLAALNVVAQPAAEGDPPVGEQVLEQIGLMVRALVPAFEAEVRAGMQPPKESTSPH